MTTNCTACGHEIRPGRRFCTHCGAQLVIACPACGAAAEPDERFCGDCGAPLNSTATPGPTSPEAPSVAGERKHITVLFADVAGSMDLQERLDAEVWASIMGRFVSILAEGVRQFGGTVDKFTGDGIMALFGAPIAQEDHARRACHAAWHLARAIGEYSEDLRRERAVELQVRLGLNSGEVVVGRVGDDVTLDPTALGHTVGLAQRMEAMAEPGRAYLTERTARLVDGWFELEELGPRAVKGARQDLVVVALGPPVTSRPILHGGALGLAPLVGRDRELALMEQALALAETGRAQVVGVVGEAGVGKSRLCDEFGAAASARGLTIRRAAGVSHAREVPLAPILAYLRDYFGITGSHSPSEARGLIAGRLLDLDAAFDESLPLVFDFLEVPDPDRPAPKLAPEARTRRMFDIIRRITAKRSQRETLILIFEDLHWFDPHSADFLGRLIDSFPGSRTLVVTNFRPEFSATWTRHSYYRQIPLAPLPEEAVGQLVDNLMGSKPTAEAVRTLLAERTAGNPFFIEELVRSMVEDGTLTGRAGDYRLSRPLSDVAVPPTVQAVLAARIDRLDAAHKEVLQTAAVIGRTFSVSVLAETLGRAGPPLDEALDALVGAELVQDLGSSSVREYRFWHPLTQEVAYRSVLAEQRRRLHAAVARAIIGQEPQRLDELAALVASHFEAGDEPLEAARWNDRAAQWALRHDFGEAVRRWKAVAAAADRLGTSDEALRFGAWVRIRLLRFQLRTGLDVAEAQELFAAGRAMAEQLGDVSLLAAVTLAYGTVGVWHGRLRDAFDYYHEAAEIASAISDPGLRAALSVGAAIADAWIGPVAPAFTWIETVLALCGDDPEVGAAQLGFSPISRSLYSRAELYAVGGRFDLARTDADKALAVALARSEIEQACWAVSVYPRIADTTPQFEDALRQARHWTQLADEIGNVSARVMTATGAGIAELGLGRGKDAAVTLEGVLAEMRDAQIVRFLESTVLAHLAAARLEAGDRESSRRTAEEALDVARGQEAPVLEAFALLTLARVRRALGGPGPVVEDDLNAALQIVDDTGALSYEPFIHEELGRLHTDPAELAEALRLYRRIGATGHARRLETELSAGGPSA